MYYYVCNITFYHFMFCFYQLISAILNIKCKRVHSSHNAISNANKGIGIWNLCVTNALYPFFVRKQNAEHQIDVTVRNLTSSVGRKQPLEFFLSVSKNDLIIHSFDSNSIWQLASELKLNHLLIINLQSNAAANML